MLKVSVVVPVFNGSATISACLESLLNQNYPADNFEIIVVDNGSTDHTPQIVKLYPVRLLACAERGPAAARNVGVAHSQADIIAFTDADCIATPGWISELTQPFIDPTVGGVGGMIMAYEHATRNMVEQFSDDCAPLINFISGHNEFLPHLFTANASYRRQLLQEVGGFNTHLLTAEDVDLAWRIQLKKHVILHYAPNAVIYHQHRITWAALGRLYRHYGFGEILLDTMYGGYPGYPRNLRFQLRQILFQSVALVRYTGSMGLRWGRLKAGRATPYEAVVPRLRFLVESKIFGVK